MATTRLLLLLVSAIAQQYAFTAPSARPPSEELRELRGAEHAIPYVVVILSAMTWSRAFLEGSVLFALTGYCPRALAHALLHALLPTSLTSDLPTALTSLTALTPTFLTGVLLILTGAFLRARCYYILGPRFTYELSIRPSHTLVTEGVYGVIRHPSYTAVLVIVAGWLLSAFDRQGPVVAVCAGCVQMFGWDGSGSTRMTSVLACVWVTVLGGLWLTVSKRMDKEDAMLEHNFGEEWRTWARRVPYRLVPGVY